MVVVVDYDAGNLYNVGNALRHLGAQFVTSGDPEVVAGAGRVILPGVGSARAAMRSLERQGLLPVLRGLKVPFLGICLGLQLLFEESEEDGTQCLGLLPGRVRRFSDLQVKVPHIGWNEVQWDPSAAPPWVKTLLADLSPAGHYYFVHSYYAPPGPHTIGRSWYDTEFSAAVAHRNFLGVQFHPERSAGLGLRLLSAFVRDGLVQEQGVA